MYESNQHKKQTVTDNIDSRNLKTTTVNTKQASGIDKHIDSLVQDCSFSIANALEILQYCTKRRYGVNDPSERGNSEKKSITYMGNCALPNRHIIYFV